MTTPNQSDIEQAKTFIFDAARSDCSSERHALIERLAHAFAARDAEWRATAEENVRLRACLELLYSVQNGCPLAMYEADWNKAMADAEVLLGLDELDASRGDAT